jgi:hypothetical protein
MTLFVLPYTEGIPYYLADAPAGKDAGASVDYAFEVVTAPNGDWDAELLIRQVALSLRGTAVFDLNFYADGALHETHRVYMQVAEPSSPSVGDWWYDLGSLPYVLKDVVSTSPTAWRVWPMRGKNKGLERDAALPVAARARSGYIGIAVATLIGDLSLGSWALGVRPLIRRV